ncbi:MAG TPA: hypothetical protein DCP31_09400 [Cyanobacteria bacterium UBA8543]|nr:hypothetical protein [Cyanobacteria bacterium UBA8543]
MDSVTRVAGSSLGISSTSAGWVTAAAAPWSSLGSSTATGSTTTTEAEFLGVSATSRGSTTTPVASSLGVSSTVGTSTPTMEETEVFRWGSSDDFFKSASLG